MSAWSDSINMSQSNKKKPKIKILEENTETDLERDIIVAGAMPADPEAKKQLKDAANNDDWTFEFSPAIIEQMKSLGITPEQLIEMIKNEDFEHQTVEEEDNT